MAIKLKQIQGGLQLQSDITNVKTVVGDENNGLVKKVNDLEDVVEVLNGDENTDGSVANSIKVAKEEIQEQLDGKAEAVHTHEADEIVESEEKQFVSAAKKAQYDENTIFTTDMLTVNGLGGIAAGSDLNNMPVQDLLTKLLFPYVAPTISASGTPNGGTFEKGNNQTITNVKAVVTKKSEKITKVEIFQGGTSLGVKEGTEVQNGGTFNFPVNVPVNSTNVQLTAKVTDALNKTYAANTGAFNFHYPYYMGVVAADKTTLTGDEIKALTKKIEGKGNKSHLFTTNNQRVVFAYPASHGNLRQIMDANNFDSTAAFVKGQVTVNGLDGQDVLYNVYINGASTVTGFKFTFNY